MDGEKIRREKILTFVREREGERREREGER